MNLIAQLALVPVKILMFVCVVVALINVEERKEDR